MILPPPRVATAAPFMRLLGERKEENTWMRKVETTMALPRVPEQADLLAEQAFYTVHPYDNTSQPVAFMQSLDRPFRRLQQIQLFTWVFSEAVCNSQYLEETRLAQSDLRLPSMLYDCP